MKTRFLFAALIFAVLLSSCGGKKDYLFNGKDLDGWKTVVKEGSDAYSGASTFTVRDSMMHVSGDPFGYIRTEKKLTDYNLHLEWRWAGKESVDGGIFNRLQDGDKVWPLGIQLQMTSKDMGVLMGGIPLKGIEGPFYKKDRIVEESPEKPVGEWNDMDFLCNGGLIKVWLNGVLVNETECDVTEGYIGIQSEGGAMDFRNIYVTYSK
jgi:hypothetical protein